MKIFFGLAALCLAVLTAIPVQAAMVSYMLNQTNANPTLADGVNYAQVTIDDNTLNTLRFTITLTSPLTSIAGSNFGIQEFGFNVAGSPSIPLVDASSSNAQWTLPSSWEVRIAPPPNQLDGFGRFEVSVATTGQGRLGTLMFDLVGSGLSLSDFAELSSGNAGQGNHFFGAHITGFQAGDGVTSAYFAGSSPVPTAVPLPTSLPLLFAGMGLMGWFSRRQSR